MRFERVTRACSGKTTFERTTLLLARSSSTLLGMPAATVDEYLAKLPEDRREAVQAVRKVILANLDKDYEEGIQYGMIGYYVPHRVFPAGYHCNPKEPLPFAGIGSQKHHIGLYLFCVYCSAEHTEWFRDAWTKTGKKLDMGKGCVRFKKLNDVPLDVVGETIKRVPTKKFIDAYQATIAGMKSAKKAAKKAGGEDEFTSKSATKSTAKKTGAKRAAK
jgi:hypothetical protein